MFVDFFNINKKQIFLNSKQCSIFRRFSIPNPVDNPITSYRQLVQQYAKDLNGNIVDPKIAQKEAITTFKKAPISASFSGLVPRLIGVDLNEYQNLDFFRDFIFN